MKRSRILYIASPQQGDLRLLGPPSGQGAVGGARTRDRKFPADLRADSLAKLPPTPPIGIDDVRTDERTKERKQNRRKNHSVSLFSALKKKRGLRSGANNNTCKLFIIFIQ
ncbi:hypothetical protein PoB_004908100 [Plakobranchus ocellatus]|uniref:Uncharacterized protein n=1 Tax=Plakobranchus ocellatus TaxID=259542 RepID=A0AAV4BU42_9GAST|nr:hypothetical protein PoB_004908100 [Plakobranchus ocellatus]